MEGWPMVEKWPYNRCKPHEKYQKNVDRNSCLLKTTFILKINIFSIKKVFYWVSLQTPCEDCKGFCVQKGSRLSPLPLLSPSATGKVCYQRDVSWKGTSSWEQKAATRGGQIPRGFYLAEYQFSGHCAAELGPAGTHIQETSTQRAADLGTAYLVWPRNWDSPGSRLQARFLAGLNKSPPWNQGWIGYKTL